MTRILNEEIQELLQGRTLGYKMKLSEDKRLPEEVREEIKNNIFTTKQKEVLDVANQPDLKMLIHHGGTGSGKTYVNNFLFLESLIKIRKQADRTRGKHYVPIFILAGYKHENLVNNVIMPIESEFGLDIKFDRNGNFMLFGVKVVTTFLNSPRGEASIRGVDAWGAYVNELTVANRSAFEELRKRLRGSDEAFVVADTNPDHPLHWVKTKYIDMEHETPGLYTVHSTPEDNPFLPDSYIRDLYNIPAGPSRDRALGYWTTGEGSVYSQFNPDYHYIKKEELPKEAQFTEFYAGVDWGWKDPTSFVLFGVAKVWDKELGKSVENTYLLKEITQSETHMEYWQNLAKEWAGKYGKDMPFYCDSAEQDRINKLTEAGIVAFNANKNITMGIESVTELLDDGRLYIVEDDVGMFKQEINAYVWNERTGQPHDVDNHVMDAVRYGIHTHKEESGPMFYF